MADGSESIEIIEHERVVPGGHESVRWYVKVGDGWQRASDHPGVERTPLARGPGVVWETRLTIRLPRATRLLRVTTRPQRGRLTALAYLERETRAPRIRQTRALYAVGPRGELYTVAERPPRALPDGDR